MPFNIAVMCETCGKDFVARRDRVEKGQGRFCSLKCKGQSHRFTAASRVCPKCGVEKPATLEFFFNRKDRPSGLILSSCKDCKMKAADDYWMRREGGRKEKNKRYFAKDNWFNKWQIAARKKDPERYRAYDSVRYKKDKVKRLAGLRVVNARRRAQKMVGGGNVTRADIQNMWVEQRGRCFYCLIDLTTFHLEHQTPLVKKGEHSPENTCLSCPTCNHRKWTLTAKEFFLKLALAEDW